MAIERITFDDERSESIRDAFKELAEKAEALTDAETKRASDLEQERNEALEERDGAQKELRGAEDRIADLEAQVENLEAARGELQSELAQRDEMLRGLERTAIEALS